MTYPCDPINGNCTSYRSADTGTNNQAFLCSCNVGFICDDGNTTGIPCGQCFAPPSAPPTSVAGLIADQDTKLIGGVVAAFVTILFCCFCATCIGLGIWLFCAIKTRDICCNMLSCCRKKAGGKHVSNDRIKAFEEQKRLRAMGGSGGGVMLTNAMAGGKMKKVAAARKKKAAEGKKKTAAAAATAALPAGWEGHVDDAGKSYYHNQVSGTTQYELPTAAAHAESDAAATWVTHMDDSGRPYYFNSATQETTYTAPSAILPAGWEGHTDDSGRAYYHNAADETTQYELPTGSTAAGVVEVSNADAVESGILPPGWERHTSDDGREYFFNAETKETTYDAPGGHTLPPDWFSHQDDAGREYFYHGTTGETSYERPSLATI